MLGRYVYPHTGGPTTTTSSAARSVFAIACSTRRPIRDEYYGIGRSSLDQELSFAQPLRGNVEIGAHVGHFALHGDAAWISRIGISVLEGRASTVVLDLRYYESGYEWVGLSRRPERRTVRAQRFVRAARRKRPRI